MNQTAEQRQQDIVSEFNQLKGWEDRYKKIIQTGKELPRLNEEFYDSKFLVKGCQSQVWMHARLNEKGEMELQADSDAMIVKGLVALLLRAYSGLPPEQILKAPPKFMEELGLQEHLSPSRANGLLSMVKQIMLYAQAFVLTR